MNRRFPWGMSLLVLSVIGGLANGQSGTDVQIPPPVAPQSPPAANLVTATVNGQPLYEIAVFRALAEDRRHNFHTLRKDILEHLINNLLIDQYLAHLKIDVSNREMDENIARIRKDLEKTGGLEKVLKSNFLTDAEFRSELAAMLRWDRFVELQSTAKKLEDFFVKNMVMFDGTQVRARHIFLKTNMGLSRELAAARLLQLRKMIEDETSQELARLPESDRNANARARIIEKVFADVATRESNCPSKQHGGDMGTFLRLGKLVEPLTRTAFQTRPLEMSDVVNTQFGCHLILVTDRRPGKEVKFQDAERLVREVYADKLKEAVIAAMKPNARIIINDPPK